MLSGARARIEEIAARDTPSFATVVEPLEELQHRVVAHLVAVSHLNAVLNSEALRNAYNTCLPLLSAYQTDLAQSEPLYRAYRAIEEREGAALDPVQRRVLEHALRDFRLAGVGLGAADKQRFNRGDAKAPRGDLLDRRGHGIAVRQWLEAVAFLAALAGVLDLPPIRFIAIASVVCASREIEPKNSSRRWRTA